MVTTVPNELVKPVHPTRMPVILDPADYETWLNGSANDAMELLRPFPADRMWIA
jgi:putative SOS response-associated peptidase YedK